MTTEKLEAEANLNISHDLNPIEFRSFIGPFLTLFNEKQILAKYNCIYIPGYYELFFILFYRSLWTTRAQKP
jgi:hypothetical protein